MTKLTRADKEALAWYFDDPVAFVRREFGVEPDAWQVRALTLYPKCPRLAMKACTGPGKTATLAWIGWHFLATRPHSMVGCASITGDNLKTGLWTELSRWHTKSRLLQAMFEKTQTEIRQVDYPSTWRLEARRWARSADKEQIGNALAGLHAKYVMWLLDETGDYPDAVMPTCEAIFSGDPVEAHIVQAGNPTRRGGPLFRAWVKRGDSDRMWEVISITADPDDPERTPRVSVQHALEQIKEYGRDNPWVRVKIFGEFPDQDFNALISEDEVRAAFNRHYRLPVGPKILGVDIADFGDDKSVIFSRQGLQAFPAKSYRHINSIDGASCVARLWADFPGVGGEADACFLDASGGYGAGWRDQLIQIGRAPIGVQFGASAADKSQFINKRVEMAWEAVEWIKRGGALCESEELVQALCQTKYGLRNDKMYLEPKDDVKKLIGYSPDEADAFWLTFAHPVTPRDTVTPRNPWRAPQEFNPFREREDVGRGFNPYQE